MTGVTFRKVSDSEIIVNWREPEATNGLILRYNITVTLHSTGQTVYTNMVSAGGGLSDMVTGLGKVHGSSESSLKLSCFVTQPASMFCDATCFQCSMFQV